MIRRAAAATVVCVLGLVVMTGRAAAHDPIFLTDEQTTPETGPLLVDGEISWAIYGVVGAPGETRGFEFDLGEGARLDLSLLIPARAPEIDLDDDSLPMIELIGPDGAVERIGPEIRVPFDEPFSNTSYVRLADRQRDADPGRYQVIVVAGAPARFTVAVGVREQFGTAAERVVDRGAAGQLSDWYATAPARSTELAEVVSSTTAAPVDDPGEGAPSTTVAVGADQDPPPEPERGGGDGRLWLVAVGVAIAGGGLYLRARTRRT